MTHCHINSKLLETLLCCHLGVDWHLAFIRETQKWVLCVACPSPSQTHQVLCVLKPALSSLLVTYLDLGKISSFPFQMGLCYLFAGSLPTKELFIYLNVFLHTDTQIVFSNKKSKHFPQMTWSLKRNFGLRKDCHRSLPKSSRKCLPLLSVYPEEFAEDKVQRLQKLSWECFMCVPLMCLWCGCKERRTDIAIPTSPEHTQRKGGSEGWREREWIYEYQKRKLNICAGDENHYLQ